MSGSRPFAIVLVACLLGAFSQPGFSLPPQSPQCNPEGAEDEISACVHDEFALVDAALDATWRDLLARLDGRPAASAAMRSAQRAWLRFRDAEADSHFPVEAGETGGRHLYGTVYPVEYTQVLVRLTRAREAQLRVHLDDLAPR